MIHLLAAFAGLAAEPAPVFRRKPCSTPQIAARATCGTVRVPENRMRPDGRPIDLNVIVIRAKSPPRVPTALFDIAGGPGLPDTMNTFFYLTEGARYSDDRDVVLLDQRGTGQSNLLDCPALAAAEDALQPMYAPAGVRACRDALSKHADLTQYTTDIAMADLDSVRRALGYSKIDLIGISYGTTAALRYIALYPEHVRSAVLMSLAPPFAMPPRYHATVAEASLKQLLADCAADRVCKREHPDVAGQLDRALRKLRSDGKVQPEVAMEVLRSRMYTPAGQRQIPATIDRLAIGDTDVLKKPANAPAIPSSLGLYLSITCAESFPWFDYARAASAARRTVFGDYRLRRQRAACTNWPRAPVKPSFFWPIRSDVPVLFVSGARDSVAALAWAKQVSRGFPDSRLVVIPWSSHIFDGLSGVGTCLDPMILGFLARPDFRRVDSRCVANMLPPPFAPDRPDTVKPGAK